LCRSRRETKDKNSRRRFVLSPLMSLESLVSLWWSHKIHFLLDLLDMRIRFHSTTCNDYHCCCCCWRAACGFLYHSIRLKAHESWIIYSLVIKS
jgi:hypothetical protein